MKRTRRAALALIVGSSSVLAVETLGLSNAETDRDVRVSPVGDANAYLGLTEDGIEDDGVLFGGDPRRPPVRFDLINRLREPLTVALTADPFRFRSAGRGEIDGDRFVVGDGSEGLGPGERVDAVTIEVPSDRINREETVTGTVAIDARGDDTRIEAERDLAIAVPDVAIGTAELDMYRAGRAGFEHEWSLAGVDTDGTELERLRFEYDGIATADALDFTAADDLSVAVAIGGRTRRGSIVRRDPTSLAVALRPPVAIDDGDVSVVLTNTGPPASPGGGNGSLSGATVELVGGGTRTRIEGVWRRG